MEILYYTDAELDFFRDILEEHIKSGNISLFGLDTETTGLHIRKDRPFLIVAGFMTKDGKYIHTVKFTPRFDSLLVLSDIAKKVSNADYYIWGWNVKFDMHMLANRGMSGIEAINWADGMAVARLTLDVENADRKQSLALKSIAKLYLGEEAGEEQKEVKSALTALKKDFNKQLGAILKLSESDLTVPQALKAYEQGEWLPDMVCEYILQNDTPNYSHVYPDIMGKYAYNDVIIMLQYLYLALPWVTTRNQDAILKQENDLIIPLWTQERTGLKLDLDYLNNAKIKVKEYLDNLRIRFVELAGKDITSGQHAEIKKIFKEWGYDIPSVNKLILPDLIDNVLQGNAKEFAELLLKIRTVEKWYSTYILRFLAEEWEGKIYTSFNQFGAVSGRLSSGFQQFPRKALTDDNGEVIFNPRRIIVPSGNGYNKLVMIDFSQMELRVQAHYTIVTSGGDLNLCRVYMPFKMTPEEAKNWVVGDVHTNTAVTAFGPDIVNAHDFKQKRFAVKAVNFGCIYGAGTTALQKIPDLRKFSYQELDLMRNAFLKTYPKIMKYRMAIRDVLLKKGYVSNAYGRRYYAQDMSSAHFICNYVIQGTCADLVKNAMIKIHNFLVDNNLKTRMILNIHDEIVYEVYKGEECIIETLQEIQQQVSASWCKIPMVSDIDYSEISWADKKAYGKEETN